MASDGALHLRHPCGMDYGGVGAHTHSVSSPRHLAARQRRRQMIQLPTSSICFKMLHCSDSCIIDRREGSLRLLARGIQCMRPWSCMTILDSLDAISMREAELFLCRTQTILHLPPGACCMGHILRAQIQQVAHPFVMFLNPRHHRQISSNLFTAETSKSIVDPCVLA